MQIPFILCMALLVISCSERNKPSPVDTSYWKSLKDSFATKHLDSFVIDAHLADSYKNFHRIQNKKIDSVAGYGTSYLYSWQEDRPGLTAFTIVVDDGEHGNRIIYFIFDQNDSLRSATQVANKGGEGGIVYETRSRFTTKDTLLKISSATTGWDLTQPAPPPRLSRTKGDSVFYYLIVSKDGQIVEKQFAEKKELNLN